MKLNMPYPEDVNTPPKIEYKDNFELKGQFLKELRTNTFSGSDHEDANEHIEKVLEIVDLFHIPNITVDQVMLRAFPMSLTGVASRWLINKPTGSITTWEDLKTKFLSKYCPPARTAKKIEKINNFQQEQDENLYQAWERFKELLMKCPQHYLTKMQEVVLFYNGLDVLTRQILDSRGVMPSKTAADAKTAIQEMAQYSQKWYNGTSRVRSTKTSNGLAAIQAQLDNLGREIKKVNEKVYVAQVECEQCKGPHYTKDCPLKEEGKTLEEAYYTQFGGPFQGGGYRATAPEIQIGKISKVLQERGFGSLPSSTEINPRNQVKSISTTIEADVSQIGRIGSSQYAVSTGQNSTLLYKSRQTTVPFPSRLDNHYCEEEEGNYGLKFTEAYGASHIKDTIPRKEKDPGSFTLPCFINNVCFDNALVDLGASVSVMPLLTYLNLGLGELAHTKLYNSDMPKDIKVPLILKRPFLSTALAKIDVYKRKITLKDGEENIIFKSVKPASSLIKRVYMLSLRERMKLDLEDRLMAETLMINRSLDPFLEDYIGLNDLNKPFGLRRNQGDYLMLTIKEGEVIEEFGARDDEFNVGIDDYPSYCDYDKKINIDYKMVYKWDNVVGALMNVTIFVGTFYVVTDFAVLEDMDDYRDEGMGDVIVGEPFLREVGIKARWFEGIITLYNGDDEVTYQLVKSHPRFKHHTNEQCNKIPPFLKISKEDKMNGISHPYQKLKGFYKGVLNLGPDYIRDAKMEEWLARGHISVHEME
ncbi:hypothetical protein Tco_1018171 [Tanacetum coccineum]|uniref:Retrotransposon gag domain-containing protein n=1 Tax=Tanacetum coccineum TaxID=301880 RepID=A0ABQ5FTK8_9ASTR